MNQRKTRPLTDMGNAECLVDIHGSDLRYCPQRRLWLIWDGTRWKWDDTLEIYRLAKSTVRNMQSYKTGNDKYDKASYAWYLKSESSSRIKSSIDMARSEPRVPVLTDELDTNPELLNCNNGTLHLPTGELRPHLKTDLITKSVGFDYVKDVKSVLWEKVLNDVLGDPELIEYFQRLCGYGLFGKATEKKLWFLHGDGDSGKSTLLEGYMGCMGDYAKSAQFTTWVHKQNRGENRGDLVDLMGSRIVVSSEARKGEKFDEEVLKRVTGGDRLKFSRKFEEVVEFRATFKLILAANDAPVIRDDDSGLWSRMQRIPCNNVIRKEDRDSSMMEKLSTTESKQAILAWAVEGFQKWLANGGVGTCSMVESSNKEYTREMDRTASFFADCTELDRSSREKTQLIWSRYDEYCRNEGIKGVSKKMLMSRIKRMGCTEYRDMHGRGWEGIRLLEPSIRPMIMQDGEWRPK